MEQVEQQLAENHTGIVRNGALPGSRAGSAGEWHQPDNCGPTGTAGLVADERRSATQPVFRRRDLRQLPSRDSATPEDDTDVSRQRTRRAI